MPGTAGVHRRSVPVTSLADCGRAGPADTVTRRAFCLRFTRAARRASGSPADTDGPRPGCSGSWGSGAGRKGDRGVTVRIGSTAQRSAGNLWQGLVPFPCRAAGARPGAVPSGDARPELAAGIPDGVRVRRLRNRRGRDHDQEALRHFRDHLRPGGALVMDTRLPHRDARNWQCWLKDNRPALPEASPPPPRPR